MSKHQKAGRANVAVADCHSAVHAALNHKRTKAKPSLSAFVQELNDKAMHKLPLKLSGNMVVIQSEPESFA